MEKAARKIFQPNVLTAMLIDGACEKGGANITEFTNAAIANFFRPFNDSLRKETELIFQKILDQEKIEPVELKTILARCVEILKDYPILEVKPLEQIFIHFTNLRGQVLRYDYIQIVDLQQDERLHRLNEILKTLDNDFNIGMHELGERSRTVFEHWDQLCRYSEVYLALSTLIELEDIYYPLSVFRTIDLIKWLDNAIRDSKLKAVKTPYPTDISLTDKYYGLRYETITYLTDNAYVELSGDAGFDHMSKEIRDHYDRIHHLRHIHGDATEEDINDMAEIEQLGRNLFKRLHNPDKKERR